jgi:hypothetical protein
VNYKAIGKKAEKKIRQYGTKAVLRIPTGDTIWDDNTASYLETYDEYQGVCLATNYEQELINDTVIKVTDKKLLCIFPAEPPAGVGLIDVYKRTGELDKTYNVVNCSPLAPDSTTIILYRVQGRA